MADQVSLCFRAAKLAQHLKLADALHAFSHHVEAHRLAHGDDRSHEGPGILVVRQSLNETAIDFQTMNREPL